jgi:PAS domain S-box-containing protein
MMNASSREQATTMSQHHPSPSDVATTAQDAQSSANLALRRQAQAIAETESDPSLESLAALSPEEARVMVHALRVYQIELELQNEELRTAQLALDASRALYFDLYDLAPVGYCTLNEQGQLLQANLTAATLLGVSRQALIKQPIFRFILKADQDIYYLHRKQLHASGETQACELRMVNHDGTPFWVHLVASDAQDTDGVSVHRVMFSDISDRKLMEAALQEKNSELTNARRMADKASLAKSDFLSSMSHELRSPLNAILGFAQLMESGSPPLAPSQKTSIDRILQSGWYLLELINEILDLSLIESGKLSLSLEPLSLPDLLLECQVMIEPQAQKSGIRISFSAFDHPCFVSGDRMHLKQSLINLLSNAIKYNRTGGVVEVTCSASAAKRLRISVRDTGEGLSPEKLAQLFQPFNRLGQEAGTLQGTGIGLVVSKRLVELMGGDIGVDSVVGVGSVFWIELDAVPAPQSAVRANKPSAALPPASAQPGIKPGTALRTLLYVEDNPANLQLVEELVARRPDIRLLTAVDGASGVALARIHLPEVILMDINLPGISGLEALAILRADPATAHIVVLALSANAMPRDIEKGLAAGFFRYLTKPIKIDEFMKALDLALEFAQTPSAPAGMEGIPK